MQIMIYGQWAENNKMPGNTLRIINAVTNGWLIGSLMSISEINEDLLRKCLASRRLAPPNIGAV